MGSLFTLSHQHLDLPSQRRKQKCDQKNEDAVPGSKGLAGLQSNAGSSPGDRPSSARRASERRVWATPSPQERAAKHAAKVKARDSRLFESSPGPGAYSTNGRTPRGGASLQSLGGGRAVFRSRSLQRQKVDSIGSGPGAYNAADALDNVSRSSFLSAGSSFNRAARAGQGGFGGLGSRDLRLEILGEDTPGPGAYRGLAATLLNAHQGRMPSAAFRSLSAQRPSFHARHGPATLLEPKYHVVEPRVRDTFGAVMRSRSERFGAPTRILTRTDSTTCATVGPLLSYDPHHALAKKLGEQAIYVHAVGRDAPGTAAFRSESVREMRAPIW
jgi:hypothetical protein